MPLVFALQKDNALEQKTIRMAKRAGKAQKGGDKEATKKGGRPKGGSYSATQLGVIEQGRKDGLGWRKIPKRHPGFGLTPEGVKTALRKLKKTNGDTTRARGSGRCVAIILRLRG